MPSLCGRPLWRRLTLPPPPRRQPDPNVLEAELSNGLIRGHAYSITKVCLADIETPRVSGQIPMIRVRNPWGNEAEWKGAFSDS